MKKSNYNYIYALLIFTLTVFCQWNNVVYSQTYPVTITSVLTPPFSGYVPDYSSLNSDKFKILVMFNDFSKPSYNIKLKLKINGQGINIESKSHYYEGPFTVEPGIPLEISGDELAGLFSSGNLDFTGINKNYYEQKKVLPEGFYSFCITAYDYSNPNNIRVSNESCAYAMMILNEPPFLNIPVCGSVLNQQIPQQIIFNWTPMNQSSINSVNQTEYVFELFEVRPEGQNPNSIVQTLPPIYTETTSLTSINYGIAEPALIPSMEYVWRVKAIDLSGRDLFKNQGYSQVCSFKWGNEYSGSNININISGVPLSHRQVKCNWDSLNVYSNYKLEFKKLGGTDTWFPVNTSSASSKINNLEPATQYVFRVKGQLLDGTWGPESNEIIVKTQPAPNYSCGDRNIQAPISQFVPLTVGAIGQIWNIGQFEMKVTQLNNYFNSSGIFSGTGRVIMDFAGQASFPVYFNNLTVNSDLKVVSGKVEVKTKGLDNWLTQSYIQLAEEDADYIDGTIDSVYINGNQYCYLVQGQSSPICKELPDDGNYEVIRDENGNQYNITNPPPSVSGPINYIHYSNDSLEINDSTIVTFEKSNNQKFGFDKQEHAADIPSYEAIQYSGNKNYFVPYKSIGENETDEFIAKVKIKQFNSSFLSFKTKFGNIIQAQKIDDNTYKIAGISSGSESIYAYYNNKKVGKINITPLGVINKKLVIVPVNNSQVSLSAQDLNSIFMQANASWSISIASNFSYNLGDDGLEAADATLMNKYSSEMRVLRDTFKKAHPNYDKEAYYLFVVPKFSASNIKGYMVRGRAVGFITSGSSVKEVAHELAHGAFGLEHTFPKIEQSTSGNLMDYGDGKHLTKIQWDFIQSPGKVINWFDQEEDAQYCEFKSVDKIFVFETLKQIKTCVNKNISYPISHLPKSRYTGYRIENVELAGENYEYIFLYTDLPNNSQKNSISPKNNISSQEKTGMHAGTGQNTPFGLITIDNAVYIEVPKDRREHMQEYLSEPEDKNLLLFVNGYRNNISLNLEEFPNSMNKINSGDIFDYWDKLDSEFMNRLKTFQAVYADGHHSIKTSNHYNQGNFVMSMNSSLNPNSVQVILNIAPNIAGFNLRKANGMACGADLINKINSGMISFNKVSDSVYVVCHSMGFAYAQGMIEALRQAKIKVARYYIIAPENACSGSVDVDSFEEVWQYGSDENNDPPKKRDGVAPQCAVGNMQNKRAYIPDDVEQDFLNSHYIKNYHWIFNKLQLGQKGYVKQRK